MELRQVRYFITLAEELHFGRAARQEHIVQSALSQQIQRLERELGVLLLERSTHHVELTAAGRAFLVEARRILASVDRAVASATHAAVSAPTLRVGILDASYDSMPLILHTFQERFPNLEIHRIEKDVPQQFKLLVEGALDVGFGRASLAPPEIASELFRLDPLGVLVPEGHFFAALKGVPVAMLAEEPLLLAEQRRAPELNQFIIEQCQAAGLVPTLYRGTVDSIRGAADLVTHGRCLLCIPSSCAPGPPGTVWKPLIEPSSRYPWSVLWRKENMDPHVGAVVEVAQALSRQLGWLGDSEHVDPPEPARLPGWSGLLPEWDLGHKTSPSLGEDGTEATATT